MGSNNYVLFRKIGGFYQVFDDGAIIVSFLTGYKIVNGRCGFPINSLDKVINIFEDNKINYVVKEGMEEVSKKNFKTNNKYVSILDKGKKKIDIDYRFGSLNDKISKLDMNEIEELLCLAEEYLDERV